MACQWATPGGGVVSNLYSGRHAVRYEAITTLAPGMISQSALSQRLKIDGFWAVQVFLEHFKILIQDKIKKYSSMNRFVSNISLEPYNHLK
jgi:hypothetical protein